MNPLKVDKIQLGPTNSSPYIARNPSGGISFYQSGVGEVPFTSILNEKQIEGVSYASATETGADFTTIQAAINDLPATGGVIYVYEGTYSENLTISKNVFLIARGEVTIEATGHLISISEASAFIHGFKFNITNDLINSDYYCIKSESPLLDRSLILLIENCSFDCENHPLAKAVYSSYPTLKIFNSTFSPAALVYSEEALSVHINGTYAPHISLQNIVTAAYLNLALVDTLTLVSSPVYLSGSYSTLVSDGASSVSSQTLSSLSDVDLSGINDGDTLIWDEANEKFIAGAGGGGGGGATDLNDLTDVTITAPTANKQILVHNGAGQFVNRVISSSDLSDTANLPLLNANQTFTGSTRATTQVVGNDSTLLATTAFVQQEITALNLGSAATSDANDFLPSNASINDLSDVNLGGALVDGKVLKVVGGVLTQADDAGGQSQEEIEDFVGAMFTNGGGITWAYDDANSQISAVVSISSTDLSDSANIPLLNANQTFTGEVRATTQPINNNSTILATTAYVESQIDNDIVALALGSAAQANVADFLASTSGLNDLSDVTIAAPLANHFLVHNGAGQFVNRLISSSDLSNSANIPLLNANQTFTGSTRASTQALADNSTLLATTEFVQQKITALNLGTASQAETGDFLPAVSSINALSDVDLGAGLVDGKILKVVEGIITQADEAGGGFTQEEIEAFVGAMFVNGGGLTWTYDDLNSEISAVVSLASTELSDTATLARLNANQTFLGSVSFPTQVLNNNSTLAATTAFVRTQINSDVAALNLGTASSSDIGDFLASGSGLNDLSDVTIALPALNHFLVHNGAGQFVNRLISTSDLSDGNDLAPLNNPALTGTPSAPTAPPTTNTTQIATTAFVQSEITALNLGATYQPLNDRLTDIAGFVPTAHNFIVGDGNDFVLKTPVDVRTSLDLDTLYQPKDPTLTSISLLGGGVNKIIYTTGVDTWAETDISAFGRGFINEVNAGTARTTLGLGTAATSNTGDFLASGSGLNDLSDVTIVLPDLNHFLVHNGLQFVNRVISSSDLTNSANIALLNANQTFSGSVSFTTQAVNNNSTLAATTAFVEAQIDNDIAALNLGTAATSNTADFLANSLNPLSEIQAAGGAVILAAQQNLNLEIGVDVQAQNALLTTLSGLNVADGNFIVGNGATFVVESGAVARTSLGLGSAATSNTGDFLASGSGLNDLSDVAIALPALKHFLVHNGAGQFVNRLISTSDLSDGNDLAPLDSPALIGTPTAPTAPLTTNTTQIATTAFVQSEITALNLGTTYQPLNDRLTEIAGLAPTAHNFIAGDGNDFVLKTPVDVRTSLELDTLYQPKDATLTSISLLGTAANKIIYTTAVDTWDEADISVYGRSLIDDADASAARITLGLEIGEEVQAYDPTLEALATVVTAANKIIYATGEDTFTTTDITANARSFIGSAAGLDDLSDATLAGLADHQALIYVGGVWQNSNRVLIRDIAQNISGDMTFTGAVNLTGATATATTQPNTDDSTKIATTAYVKNIVAEVGGVASLDDLTDVAIGGVALATGQVLRFDAVTLEFKNAALAHTDLSDGNTLAPLNSPALTGTPTAPTAPPATNTTQIATTQFVQQEINDLGLGTASTKDAGTGAGEVLLLLEANKLPVLDGTNLTGVVLEANNLSDLADIPTARTNLGLGTAATSNTGDFLASGSGLDNLSDVTINAPTALNQFLVLNGAGQFENRLISSSDLSNSTNIPLLNANQTFSGDISFTGDVEAVTQADADNSTKIATTEYVDRQVGNATTTLSLEDLTDVGMNPVGDKQVLIYVLANNQFENRTISSADLSDGASVVLEDVNGDASITRDLSVSRDISVTGVINATAEGQVLADFTFNNGEIISATGSIDLNAQDVTTTGTITAGGLVVNGTTTTINTVTLAVQDPIIRLASGASSVPVATTDTGFIFTRGSTQQPAVFYWDRVEAEFFLATANGAVDNTEDFSALNPSLQALNISSLKTTTSVLVGVDDPAQLTLSAGSITSANDTISFGNAEISTTGLIFAQTPDPLSNTTEVVTSAWVRALSVDALSDVDTTTTPPANGQALVWDGTNWAPANVAADLSGIQTELDTTQTSLGLDGNGALPVYISTHYINDNDSHHLSLGNLDDALFTTNFNLSALQDEVDATQTGAGLDISGAYLPNLLSNYLTTATSLKNADDLLDTEIKSQADTLATLGTAAFEDVGDFLASGSGLNDLSDVTITAPTALNQFLVHNGAGQFENRLISSSDLSDGNDLAPLDSPALTGTPTAPTGVLGTNTTQIATTAFVQSEITALNLGTTYQPLNDRLSEIAGLAPSDNHFIVGDGVSFSLESPADVRTSLDLDTLYQPKDDTLSSISALGTAANKIIYTTGVNTWAETDISVYGRSLIDDADAGTARTTLGLGTAATSNTGDFLASGSGLNDLSDVTIALPALNHFLVHNGAGQFENRVISSSDLSDGNTLAPLDSPALTGTPTAPTGVLGTNTTQIATTAFVQQEINDLNLGTASQADAADFLQAANNLSDLVDTATARTNLGLTSTATTALNTLLQAANNLSDLTNTGTARTNLGLTATATTALTALLQVANALSEIAAAGLQATARTNLGLGSASTRNAGTGANEVLLLDGSGELPSIGKLNDVTLAGLVDNQILKSTGGVFQNVGFTSTNLTDSADLVRDADIGTAATYDVGTTNGTIPVLTPTGLPAVSGVSLTALGSIGLHSDVDLTGLADGNTLLWDDLANKFIPSAPDSGLTQEQVRDISGTALENGVHSGVTGISFTNDDANDRINLSLSVETRNLTDVSNAVPLNGQILQYDGVLYVPVSLGTATNYDVGISAGQLRLLTTPSLQNTNDLGEFVVKGRLIETYDYGSVASAFNGATDWSVDYNGAGLADNNINLVEDYGVFI